MAEPMPASTPPGRPPQAEVREWIRRIEAGHGPADLAPLLLDSMERIALRVLLAGQPDADAVAEQLSPGLLNRLRAFAGEGKK